MSLSEHRYFSQARYAALRLVSDKLYGRKAAQPGLVRREAARVAVVP
jgi:hypothetical protein